MLFSMADISASTGVCGRQHVAADVSLEISLISLCFGISPDVELGPSVLQMCALGDLALRPQGAF